MKQYLLIIIIIVAKIYAYDISIYSQLIDIKKLDSEKSILDNYKRWNVVFYRYDNDGDFGVTNYMTYMTLSNARIGIKWKDGINRSNFIYISIKTNTIIINNELTTINNLKTIEYINKSNISFIGFGSDYGGIIMKYNNGVLDNCIYPYKLRLYLAISDWSTCTNRRQYSNIFGDGLINSTLLNEEMKKKIIINEIQITK